MPKVRQRNPDDQVKTKGKNHSGIKKKNFNVSRQIESAVKQKVKQREGYEAANESATTTTEQAVTNTVADAAKLTGKAVDTLHERVIRQHSPEPVTPTNTSRRQTSPYTEQSRNLTVREYAAQSYIKTKDEPDRRQSITEVSPDSSHSVSDNRPLTSPKVKPVRDYSSHSPQQEKAQSSHLNAVEQGRRLAVEEYAQTRAKQAEFKAEIIESRYSIQNPTLPQDGLPPLDGASPTGSTVAASPNGRRATEISTPKQKPKSAPKLRANVESVSPKMVRPEKVNRTTPIVSNAQKAAEMGRRKFVKEAQKQMAVQVKRTAKAAADVVKKTASAILKAIQATVSMLAGIFGGTSVVVILMVVLLIGAILASPFGILFANEPVSGAITLSSAVAQISMEFSTQLNALQEGEYESIAIAGAPPDWIEVIAVFACHVAGGEDGVDVMVLDDEKMDKLRTVFWDMCVITAEEEIEEQDDPATPTDESTEPVVHLTITIEAKTADDMRLIYHFSKFQNNILTELLAEEETLRALIGDLNISQSDAIELMNNLSGDISESRKAVVRQALTLVGKVNYFWGGKSLVIGWDSRWGQPMEVWAAGSPTTGTIRPYGLDCSGFVDWAFYNVSGGSYVMGHGGGVATQHVYCQNITWEQAQPGDLVFYPDDSHVGIIGGRDAAGNIQVIHCASGMNNVVITGKSGFTTVGRPNYYSD